MNIRGKRVEYWAWLRQNCDSCYHGAARHEFPNCAIQHAMRRAMSPVGHGDITSDLADEAGVRKTFPWGPCRSYRRGRRQDGNVTYIGY